MLDEKKKNIDSVRANALLKGRRISFFPREREFACEVVSFKPRLSSSAYPCTCLCARPTSWGFFFFGKRRRRRRKRAFVYEVSDSSCLDTSCEVITKNEYVSSHRRRYFSVNSVSLLSHYSHALFASHSHISSPMGSLYPLTCCKS